MNSKLNPNAQAWVAALRSGEYKQGTGSLERDGKFCCLGVACDLALKSGVDLRRIAHSNGTAAYDDCVGLIPGLAKKWIGLRYSDGQFSGGCLIELNDKGVTFAEIADIIESAPKGLFLEVAE